MFLSDLQFRHRQAIDPILTPFNPRLVREPGTLSHGLSAAGYDVTMIPELRIFRPTYRDDSAPIDPLNFDPAVLTTVTDVAADGSMILPAHSYALTATAEYFRMPKDMMALVIGKSTYARCGLIINATPLEPGWEGQVTLELYNASRRPMKLYPGQGLCQVLFSQLSVVPEQAYDSSRKYQGQQGIVLPKAERKEVSLEEVWEGLVGKVRRYNTQSISLNASPSLFSDEEAVATIFNSEYTPSEEVLR